MTNINPNQAVNSSEAPADRVGDIKTLYSVSAFEIIWRGMLAGFSRALGSILIYVAFMLIAAFVFITYVYPSIEPIITEYRQLMNSLNLLMPAQPTDGIQPSFYQTPPSSGLAPTSPQIPELNLSPDQINSLLSNPDLMKILNQM